VLVHLVEAMPLDGSDPVENYRAIRNELTQYSPALAERPELLVITKLDVTGASESRERITRELCRDAVAISAVTGLGIPQLIHRIVAMLEPPEQQDPPTEPPALAVMAAAVSTSGA
jgi:GTPase